MSIELNSMGMIMSNYFDSLGRGQAAGYRETTFPSTSETMYSIPSKPGTPCNVRTYRLKLQY